MADMLVKLYDLPSLHDTLRELEARGVVVRRARVPERAVVLDWTDRQFTAWTPEVDVAFTRLPVTCWIAVRQDPAAAGAELIGLACHDVMCRNFFGPMAVDATHRLQGVGRALLLAALHAQRDAGYAYSIIAGVGPEAFYGRAVQAITIPGSTPGVYAGMLRAWRESP
ncbi:MAG: GNAT family N-acetyltransferase [Pseudomonadota bacterium]|nr:GNAT family N-acetyltransferase [Pseudomonadota bacterium]